MIFSLNVVEKEAEDNNVEQFIEDENSDYKIGTYYDITLTKEQEGRKTQITDIQKNTDTTGKIRITIDIPNEYRGHKNYSVAHVHNGEIVTITDIDDNPNTITFETSRFSEYALIYEENDKVASITKIADGKIKVYAREDAILYIGDFNGNKLNNVRQYDIKANDENLIFDFSESQTAFVWDKFQRPLCSKYTYH